MAKNDEYMTRDISFPNQKIVEIFPLTAHTHCHPQQPLHTHCALHFQKL